MRVVLIASGEFALPSLEALHRETGFDIPLVMTSPDRPAGRGRRATPTSVKSRAIEFGVPVMEVEDINAAESLERIRPLGATVGLVIAFGQKVLSEFRDLFSGGCVNLHASLLPAYRGAAPYQWAVIRGECETGVTVFHLVDRMDAGPVLSVRETTIGETETAAELHDRLALLGPEAVLDALRRFHDGRVPAGRPQDESQATKAPKFAKRDGLIHFDQPARALAGWINGLWSWPGATCVFLSSDGSRRERVKLARARVAAEDAAGPPGVVDSDRHVNASPGVVELLEVKPEGGRLMDWRSFARGRSIKPGDRFESVGESAAS